MIPHASLSVQKGKVLGYPRYKSSNCFIKRFKCCRVIYLFSSRSSLCVLCSNLASFYEFKELSLCNETRFKGDSTLSFEHQSFVCLLVLELSNLDNSHISTTNETHLDMLHNHRLCVLMSQGSLHWNKIHSPSYERPLLKNKQANTHNVNDLKWQNSVFLWGL